MISSLDNAMLKRRFLLSALAVIIVPLMAVWLGARVEAQDARPTRPGQVDGPLSLPMPSPGTISDAPFTILDAAREPMVQHQVRIRGRIVVRVTPGPRRERSDMLADLPRRALPTRYAEVDHADCIRAQSVIGVQPSRDGRLLFFTDQQQILAAELEEGCAVRAFYAGFYAERARDGRLCVDRDRLQSRAGAICQLAGFSRLVAIADQ